MAKYNKYKWFKFEKGRFCHDTLTVKFGHESSKKKPPVIAQAVRVPTFKYKVMERADAGGGCYYSYSEEVEYVENNAYIILKDGQIIGWMKPYYKGDDIPIELWPLDWYLTNFQIRKFAAKLA